jgi:hypothetical protein
MKHWLLLTAAVFSLFLGFATNANATVITFDDAIVGSTTYQFDSDGDGVKDVIFSTTDPGGFNTVGPGTNMKYIQQPGLEGTSLLNPDLRVDFLNQAKDFLKFGFALDSLSENSNTWTGFTVFDAGGNLLTSDTEFGLYTYPDTVHRSNYPEGQISVTFSGVASYALFNFSSDYGRYIIDNFEGTYGSTEVPPASVPEPGTFLLLGLGLMGVAGIRIKAKK